MLTVDEVAARGERMLDELERAVVGKRRPLELVLLAFLADGHVLLEDYPGLAKTLIARSFAQVCEMEFSRIQFTPDLMPSDVTGSAIYDQRRSDFEFRPGPIFTNLLLGDEINRAPPKTQAALLEAMQERQGTIEGETRPLQPPALVTRSFEPKLVWYTGLAAAGLLAALAARLPELVALAGPFALAPAIGLLLARAPELDASVTLERERALEGDELEATVVVAAAAGAERVDVLLELPPGIVLVDGDNPVTIHIADRRSVELPFRLRCERWGGYALGRVFVRARDPFGLVRWEQELDRRAPLKVYPREELVRTLLRPY